MSDWDASDVTDQSGKTVLITGANSGIGFEAAKVFVDRGAHVVLACRSRLKADGAVDQIMADEPAGTTEILELDLADLDSVESAAAAFTEANDRLDILVNNAGLMATPKQLTPQGHELQFGVNHLGHFALTGRLFDTLTATGTADTPARVVTISSQAHRGGKIDFDNLDASKKYNPWSAYGRSKLANLLFMRELDRRCTAANLPVMSVAAHPGGSSTNLGNENAGDVLSRLLGLLRPISDRFAQSAEMGSLPTLRAAVDPLAHGGDYYGPDGFQEMRGNPKKVAMTDRAADPDLASRLWDVSEELTGVTFPG